MRRQHGRSIFAAMCLAAGAATFTPFQAAASDLIYQPLNPAFGGSPLLDDYLISTAQIQNRFVNTGGSSGGGSSAPPIINFPPITIELGGVNNGNNGDTTDQSADSSAFVGQIGQ